MNIFILKACVIILILCLFRVSRVSGSVDISRDFKILLMYFSEAFLKGAVFDGKSLEEDKAVDVAKNLVEAIETLENYYPDLPDLEELGFFKLQLAAGIPIANWILNSVDFDDFSILKNRADKAQFNFIKAMKKYGRVILPIGWIGHSMALIIKQGKEEDTFDVAVINTGQGIEFHYHSADPNGVYPILSQVWIEFEGVKSDELFTEDAWFFQGLIAIRKEFFRTKLQDVFDDINDISSCCNYYAEYFYGSFLANFKKYLVPPKLDRLIPMQRSGSCSVSSLIGALLYTSKSESTFYLHRLRIGHALIKSFLDKAQGNNEFKIIIMDGFETNGRNFLKVISSSLAQKTLEYLEFALPEHFKHAGLIGRERFKWLFEKKEAAIEALKEANPIVFESVKISINLINEIISFLKDNPISTASTDIFLTEEAKTQFQPHKIRLVNNRNSADESGDNYTTNNFFDFLKGTCECSEKPLKSFNEFYEAFIQFNDIKNNESKVYYRALNIFQRAHENGKGHYWLDDGTTEQLLEMQEICEKIALSFANFDKKFTSFDDIVLLTFLQTLSWKLAVQYDNRLADENKIGLGTLAAPQTLQNSLFGFNSKVGSEKKRMPWHPKKVNIFAGNLKQFVIHNIFDQKNVELFLDLLKEDENEIGKERFMGPDSFCNQYNDFFKLESSQTNSRIYRKMIQNPEVETILASLRSTENIKQKWIDIEDNYAKFLIVFAKENNDGLFDLINYFPHYYNLMNTLALVRVAPLPNISSSTYWIKNPDDPNVFKLSYTVILNNIDYYENSYMEAFEKYRIDWFDFNSTNYYRRQNVNVFYRSRHSAALTSFNDITNIETWFNYIKDSLSAKLFDSSYFQYITDHLLNVPKFEGAGIILFPINDLMARSIIAELSRLIMISLNTIKAENDQILSVKRNSLIRRSVNVSVILTRFISRIDSMKILDGSECAKSLAQIYNLIIDFANFKSNYNLIEQEISRINFALAHICSVPIRNALTFMNNVNLGSIQKGLRMTLKRYHWFAAKKSYTSSGVERNVADEQFNYGTTESPLSSGETSFLENLLITYFLPSDSSNSVLANSGYTFRYNYEMYLVNIKNPLSESDFFINLWTGATVLNGLCMINNSIFINSEKVQKFISAENMPSVYKGISVEFSGMSIYALPDFKGSSYLITVKLNELRCLKIHRKWNEKWYLLTTFNEIKYAFEELNLNHAWIREDSWMFRRNFGQSSQEIIIFLKDDINPVMRFILDEINTIKVEIEEFNEGSDWTIIGRENPSKSKSSCKISANMSVEKSIMSNLSHGKDAGNIDLHQKMVNILNFERYFERFNLNNYILAKDDSGRFLIICINLRLPEDLRRPLVFREKTRNSETEEIGFKILNLPNTDVFPNQSLGGSSSLPGGLVIISDSKKALILANIGENENPSKPVQVEKIPILDDKPAPQTRKQKLLLAYYLILQFEFNSARKLLNPSSSINHNEVFSISEINILTMITKVDLEAPEALALKLFAFIHYELNRQKFIFDYSKNNLPSVPIPNTLTYMLSVREMSEKYYVFLIFPEILEVPFFKKLFTSSSLNVSPEPTVEDDENDIGISISDRIDGLYNIGDRIDSSFISLILSGNLRLLRSASRLMIRKNSKNSFENQAEMAVFCFLNDSDLFQEYINQLNDLNYQTSNKEQRENIIDESMDTYEQAMIRCIGKYKEYFKGINQSLEMTKTSENILKDTFKAENNILRLNVISQNPIQETLSDLVSPLDIFTISNAETILRNLLKSGNDKTVNIFDDEYVIKSKVLSKLQKSINDFISENGQFIKSEIDLIDNIQTLKNLQTLFYTRINELSTAQTLSGAELISAINIDISSFAIGSLFSTMHQRKVKTFESLYACYLMDSLVCIQKKFPQLNIETCLKIKEDAKRFFIRQILINFFELLHNSVQGLLELAENSKPVSFDTLNIFCDELSKINDFNERMKDPVIMNFEFRSQIYRLKNEQVNDIALLTVKNQMNAFPSLVIQRMMAAGKTLVLGTISVVKKALDSSKLSILVPPSSLYQSNITSMQNNTYDYFKKKGVAFTFPRFSLQFNDNSNSLKLLESYLKTVRELINNTMKDSNYMILSPDTLHSFLNSYIEALLNAENNWDEKYCDKLIIFSEIYRIFKDRGSIILDEIDMTMDPKKELNFPTQETEPYNMVAVVLLADIMEFMIFDDKIIEAGLHIHSNNQASLTEPGYKICIDLVLDYIGAQLETDSSIWYKLIFESKPHDATVDNIMSFLTNPNMAGEKEWITEFHSSGDEEIANALIIVKYQLHHQMKNALKGTVNHNFGAAGNLRPEIKFAVPYVAANTPSTSSIFADRWETLVKTLLMVSASPCSLKTAKSFIEYAQMAIRSESAISGSLEAVVTYKNLKLILPTDFCPMSLDIEIISHVEAIQQALSTRSPAAIRLLFSFYITQVFDKMIFPTEQITSNALNVTSMFNSVQGYSGTIDNVNILPQHVIKEAYDDNLRNEKYNGGISLKLVKDCDDCTVEELDEEFFKKSPEDMVQDLMSLYPSDDVSAIIDTGAFFKNFKNSQVARAVLSALMKFKAVLYYDEDSNQLKYLRITNGSCSSGILESSNPNYITKTVEVELEERFTFYDQRHITGSDILQPKTAHAIMTVGPRVLLRDILQATFRMRQFMTSQKVHLVTTKASRNFYNSKIKKVEAKDENLFKESLVEIGEKQKVAESKEEYQNTVTKKNDETIMKVSDVLILGALNEDEKQEHENVKLAFGKINAEIRAFVLDEISRILTSENPDKYLYFLFNLITRSRSLFIRSIKEYPLDWLNQTKDENATQVLKSFAISRLHPLSDYLKDLSFMIEVNVNHRFNSLKKRIKEMISPANKKFYYDKDTIRLPINLNEGLEVHQLTLMLNMTDVNMDNEMTTSDRKVDFSDHFCDLLKYCERDFWKQYLESNEAYVCFEDLYYRSYLNNYLGNTLVTSGAQIGVARTLVDTMKKKTPSEDSEDEMKKSTENEIPYPIFSKYTFEGSHILVQVYTNNVKALLICSKHASDVFKKLQVSNECNVSEEKLIKFWLCDLSGSVTISNDAETEIGQNVLDFIPQIDNLIFDLLIFNGSLPQILSNPKLKVIYENWLKSKYYKERAMFLRLRMKALMEKDKEIFEVDDQNLKSLQEYSMGIKNSNFSSVDGYRKPEICAKFETQKIELLKIKRMIQQDLINTNPNSIDFDLNLEIRRLLKISREEESNSIEGPDFIAAVQEHLNEQDINLDETETSVKTLNNRSILNVQMCPLSKERLIGEYQERIIHRSENTEIYVDDYIGEYQKRIIHRSENTEIYVDDYIGEYQEPAYNEILPDDITEITINLK